MAGQLRRALVAAAAKLSRFTLSGNTNSAGRLSTVDLLLLTSMHQLLSKLKIFFTSLQNELPNKEVNYTERSFSVSNL